jgi:hypothetical protein
VGGGDGINDIQSISRSSIGRILGVLKKAEAEGLFRRLAGKNLTNIILARELRLHEAKKHPQWIIGKGAQ